MLTRRRRTRPPGVRAALPALPSGLRGPARRERGFGLFSTALGVAVVGALVASAASLTERRLRAALADQAYAAAADLSDAATAGLRAEWEELAGGFDADSGLAFLPLQDLVTDGLLPAGWQDATRAFGEWRILMRRVPLVGGDARIDTIVWSTGAFTEREALAAAGRAGFGALATSDEIEPGRLRGPGLNLDPAPWQNPPDVDRFAPGDIIFHASHHPDALFGPALYRTAVPGRPELNRMEADLDLGGFDLLNAGGVATEELTLEGNLAVGGELTVEGDAGIEGLLTAGSLEATGELTAARLAVAGVLTADGIEIEGELRALTGDFEQLTVGSCSGC